MLLPPTSHTHTGTRYAAQRLIGCWGLCTTQQGEAQTGSVVGHVAGGGAELGIALDDLVDGVQEILLVRDL
jgi:hypothetical protein